MRNRLLRITEEERRAREQTARYQVNSLAKLCSVSVSTLARHIQVTRGRSPHEWLRARRMERALELLADGSAVKETAAELGYETPQHFSRDFKEVHGYPSGEHAQRICGDTQDRHVTGLDTK